MGDTDAAPIPAELGRYRILSRLGTGGMAEVFLAKSTGAEGIEKLLVVKRVLPTFARSGKFISMFTAEAKVAVRLNHPNIVQVYGFEQVREQFLLAMEFVDGLDLGRLLSAARRADRRLPFGIAAYVVMEVARGLDYAHRRRDDDGQPLEIVHRDVSPQNVLLAYEGVVKVADFGIAKARMVSEETGVIKGKFAYMSPEQARGERVDHRSDVYSLGVLLAELLMNRAMYPGKQGLDVLEEVRKGRVTMPRESDPTVPVELDRIVRRAAAFDREERFQTARQFASALAQYLHALDEVYDGEVLEGFITEVAPRERTSPDPERPLATSTAPTLASAAAAGEAELRERRHVVVVAGRVHGRPSAAAGSEEAAPGIGDEAARVLADIAYKADAVLTWPEGAGRNRFRFILGLGKPSVHDPLHAVGLALDVREALQGLSVDLDVPLTASLGVSRGVVSTVRDTAGRLLRYEPVGAVLEVAVRMSETGDPAEVLVAGEVYRLVRRVYAFDEEAGREVAVQTGAEGETRAVRAYRVRGALTREERAAVALAASAAEGLVGRAEELESLAETYQEALTTRRALYVAVEGDLGVGKSALVGAALRSFEPPPRILRGECAFGTSDVPFAATAELVREACGIADDTPLVAVREQVRELVSELMPHDPERRDSVIRGLELLLGPAQGGVDGDTPSGEETDRSRVIMGAVETLLHRMAAQGPLVVWLDALQWADAPTLGLLRLMIQHPFEDVPFLGVLSTRLDARTEPVVAAAPRIELAGLGPDERRRLVRQCFNSATVPLDVEKAVVERAGGNPFFLIELVDALLERGAVSIEGDGEERRVVRRPEVAIALPTTLEGVIAARLGELSEPQRRALRWLAMAGPGLRARDLSALAGSDLSGTLEQLEERRLIHRRPGGAYAFPSAVVRHVAYETTDADDRVRMHRSIAKYLESLGQGAPPARIARHLEHAGEHAKAAEAYFEAAQAARRVYSNREALRFYGRALALWPGDSLRRFWAHEACEQIYRGMGRRPEQLRELESLRRFAERRGTAAMRALVYNRLARYGLDGADTQGVEAYLRRATDAAVEAGDAGAEIEALRQTAQLAQELGDTQRALQACDRALARAGQAPEFLAARGSVLVQRSLLSRRIGRMADALRDNTEAVVIFRRLGIKRNEAHALNSLGIALVTSGSFQDGITALRASIKLDREIGDRFLLGRKLSNIGQAYAELGHAERGVDFLRRALEVFRAVDDQGARSDALSSMAELLLEAWGDADAAALELDQARRLAERTGDLYDLARERLVRANLEAAAGRLERAERCARDAIDHAREGGLVSHELLGLATLADSLSAQGRTEEALDLARQARAGLREHGSQRIERAERVHVAIARTLARLGQQDEARIALEEARRMVDSRVEQIREGSSRDRYLARALVREVRGIHAPDPA